jgi:hypothetical protein
LTHDMNFKHHMNTVRTVVTLSALGLALVSPCALGADQAAPADPANPANPAAPGNGDTSTQPAVPGTPAVPATPPDNSSSAGNPSSNPGADHKPSGSQVATDIRQIVAAASKARADFLKNQQDLRSTLRTADKDSREQIRSRLQEQRDAFLVQQRDAREDLKKKIATLREQLKDHRDAIDDAKQNAKDAAHGRKGD